MSRIMSVSRINSLPHCFSFCGRSGTGAVVGVVRICGTSSAGRSSANGTGEYSRRRAMRVESVNVMSMR